MPTAKKPSGRTQIKVKDMKAKKNPKGGLNYAKKPTAVERKAGDKFHD